MLDQAIKAVRPCGVVSVPGVYGGPVSVNMGQIVQKGLTLRSGQTHVKRYLEPLTKLIQEKKVDTTFLITHRSTTWKTARTSTRSSRTRRTAA